MTEEVTALAVPPSMRGAWNVQMPPPAPSAPLGPQAQPAMTVRLATGGRMAPVPAVLRYRLAVRGVRIAAHVQSAR
jgi:hypothetical protein